jgi:electron transport complex protein RnfD
MWLVSLCAFLVVIQSSLNDTFSSFLVALVAVITAVLTEFLVLHERGRMKALKDGSAVTTALILALLLPNGISPAYAAMGAIFAIAVIKHSFGGLGSNWLNPAAGGWLFVRFSWPAAFERSLEASPLSALSEGLNQGISNPYGSPMGILSMDTSGFSSALVMDDSIRSTLNSTIFSLFGVELPTGYMELFSSPFTGIIADRGVFALLLGTILISSFQVNRAWIPAAFLAVFGLLVRVFGALPYGGGLWNGDVLFALCSGGTLVAAFFLAAEPSSGAKSNGGILLAAVVMGAFAYVFRYIGAEPYGAIFAVLAVNAIVPVIRFFENLRLYERGVHER